MSENIISIVGCRNNDEAQADALECLRVWMALVECGEITSVAIAGVGPGRAEFGHSSWLDERLLGSVAILQQDMAMKLAGAGGIEAE
jgi:hypothetical protein